MRCWLFWRVLVSSLILIKFSECCAVETNLPIKEVLKKNEESPWLALIGDKTDQRDNSVQGLSYGAVIKSNLILTLAAAVSKTSVENLLVITNCSVTHGIDCDTNFVTKIFFPPNSDPNHVNESDPIFLMLTTPLEFSAKVSPVRLAISNDDFDPDDCMIYHWQSIFSYATYQGGIDEISDSGVLNIEFQVSLNPDRFGMAKTEEVKMMNDIDCFFERCFAEGDDEMTMDDSMLPIHFMGSPIVCKLKNADDQVMVGFSTYTYGVDIDDDNIKIVSLINGTLVQFSSELDNFFDGIINT